MIQMIQWKIPLQRLQLTTYYTIHRIEIYTVDSVLQPLKQPGPAECKHDGEQILAPRPRF